MLGHTWWGAQCSVSHEIDVVCTRAVSGPTGSLTVGFLGCAGLCFNLAGYEMDVARTSAERFGWQPFGRRHRMSTLGERRERCGGGSEKVVVEKRQRPKTKDFSRVAYVCHVSRVIVTPTRSVRFLTASHK